MEHEHPEASACVASLVVPVYGNRATVAQLCDRVLAALPTIGEIILVIDGRPDDAETCITLAAHNPRIKIIELAENVGQHRAIVIGLAHARGQTAITMDADLQDRPEDLPALLACAKLPGVDVAYARRTNRFAGFLPWFTGRLFKWSISLRTRGRIPARAGMFLAIRADIYRQLIPWQNHNIYILGLLARLHANFRGVDVIRNPAAATSYTFARRWRLARRAVTSYRGRMQPAPPAKILRTLNLAPQSTPAEAAHVDR